MITTLEGQRLPSHGELYEVLARPFFKERLYYELSRRDFRNQVWKIVKEMFNLNDSVQDLINYELLDSIGWHNVTLSAERDNWDLTLYRANNCTPNAAYFCEYKSNVQEWGKEIDDFIRQIKGRAKNQLSYLDASGDTRRLHNDVRHFVCLLTFDERFEKYRAMLEGQDIRLVILSQEWLKQKDGGGGR